VEERGLKRRVLLTGFEEDVASWLNEMDVFLLTSRTEGLPNVLIEAQGFGVPVVTTDAGGAREVVENNSTGVVVESSDPVDLSLAVAMYFENRENWSRNARSKSRKKFSIKSMIDSTEVVYSEILSA
jgi:glycosyltransferase involved in cell wall biosynthesis